MWEIRVEVTRALEQKRKNGDIGHSLDSCVQITAASDDIDLLEAFGTQSLADLFIVSQIELAGGGNRVVVEVLTPGGAKCGRCWKFAESVGASSDHPEICDRCFAVVTDA